MSCPIQSCPVLSSHVLSCPVLSYPVMSCPVLSYPVMSCPVLSSHVLSCPVMSCPVLLACARCCLFIQVSVVFKMNKHLSPSGMYFSEEGVKHVVRASSAFTYHLAFFFAIGRACTSYVKCMCVSAHRYVYAYSGMHTHTFTLSGMHTHTLTLS
jgi:hypothetical protein